MTQEAAARGTGSEARAGDEIDEARVELTATAERALPESLAPSIRRSLAESYVDGVLPPVSIRTPTALEREQEIRQRLAQQDEHDARRLAEIERTEQEVAEAVQRAEYVAQAIQVRSFQLEPNLPPPSEEPLSDEDAEVLDREQARLEVREKEIDAKRNQDLATLDEPLHPLVETHAKLDVVAATGDYQQNLARAGINPRTVELQLEVRRAQLEAAAQAAQAQADAKKAAAGSPLARLAIPSQPVPQAPPAPVD